MPNPADPFARFTTHQELPPTRPETQEVSDILIRCKDCDEDCMKNYKDEWVHVWEIKVSGTVFGKDYHRANPDIIDVEVVDVVPD